MTDASFDGGEGTVDDSLEFTIEKESPALYSILRECAEACEFDLDRAVEAVLERLKDKKVLRTHLSMILHQWARSQVRHVRSCYRRAAKDEAPLARPADAQASAQAAAAERANRVHEQLAYSMIENFHLSTGKKLGDSGRDELVAEIATYRLRARDNAICASWMQAIADKVGAKKVRDVFTDEQIVKLVRKAEQC